MADEESYDYSNARKNLKENASVILNQLDPADTIREIEMILRAEIEDPETGEPIKAGVPLMTDEGIDFIIGRIKFLVNQNVALGNWKEEKFRVDMISFSMGMNRLLTTKREEWEIDAVLLPQIIDGLDNLVSGFISGSIDGKKQKLLASLVTMRELRTDNQPKKYSFSETVNGTIGSL